MVELSSSPPLGCAVPLSAAGASAVSRTPSARLCTRRSHSCDALTPALPGAHCCSFFQIQLRCDFLGYSLNSFLPSSIWIKCLYRSETTLRVSILGYTDEGGDRRTEMPKAWHLPWMTELQTFLHHMLQTGGCKATQGLNNSQLYYSVPHAHPSLWQEGHRVAGL